MRAHGGALFCSYHARVAGRLHPLVVFRVLSYRFNKFDAARVIALDPHGAFAADAVGRGVLNRVRYLLHDDVATTGWSRDHPSLEAAAHIVHRACMGEPTATINYVAELRCYVVPEQEEALAALESSARVAAAPSPQLASLRVRVLQADPSGGLERVRSSGVWLPLECGCPWAPQGVSDDEASAEAERMVRAGGGATSGHVGTARLGKRKRSKKTSHVAVGKVFFIDEEVAGRAREPHIVVETHETAAGEWPTGEAPFSRNPECCKWATAQSLADPTTDRVLPQNQLVPLNRHFEDRVQEHLGKGHLRGELCPSCRALIRAVQEVATGSVPPMVFASAWKRFAPKVAPPPLPDDGAAAAATVATGKHARGEEPSEAAAGAERRVAARATRHG